MPQNPGFNPYEGNGDHLTYDIIGPQPDGQKALIVAVRDRNDQSVQLTKAEIAHRWGWKEQDFDVDYHSMYTKEK